MCTTSSETLTRGSMSPRTGVRTLKTWSSSCLCMKENWGTVCLCRSWYIENISTICDSVERALGRVVNLHMSAMVSCDDKPPTIGHVVIPGNNFIDTRIVYPSGCQKLIHTHVQLIDDEKLTISLLVLRRHVASN